MKTATLAWRRPVRHTHPTTGFIWRRYVSRCGNYRVAVRVDAKPLRFYAERWAMAAVGRGCVWSIIGKAPHRTLKAAKAACEREARRVGA